MPEFSLAVEPMKYKRNKQKQIKIDPPLSFPHFNIFKQFYTFCIYLIIPPIKILTFLVKFLSVFIAPSEMMKNKFYLGPFVSSHITLAKFQFNRKTSQLDFEALNLCLKNCKSFHMHNISTPSRKSQLMSLIHLRPMLDLCRTR